MTHTHPNVELHRRAQAAVDSGDMDTLTALLAEDATMRVPGGGATAGTYRGRTEILGVFARMAELTDGTVKADRIDVLGSDERTFGFNRFSARRSDGRELDTYIGELIRWRDGKWVDNRIVPLDMEAYEAFMR